MEIDDSPVIIEYTFEEHELLNSIMVAALDSIDTIVYGDIHDLPKDSPISIRYELLNSMRQRSLELWSNRFGVNS